MNAPETLEEFIGQKPLVDNLKIYIKAAKQQSRMLDHILLYGPSGLGKTTLARCIANSFDAPLQIINAASITHCAQLASIFSQVKAGDFVFIDEVHRLIGKCEEFLYPILQEYRMDFFIDYLQNSKVVNLTLPPFTLIAATTKLYACAKPLVNRFPIQFALMDYTEHELESIIRFNAESISLQLNNDVIRQLVYVSRFTPRLINMHLRRLYDYQLVYDSQSITMEYLSMYLRNHHLNAYGLSESDLRYLGYLYHCNSSVGLARLSIALRMDESSIVDYIEPYLIQLKWIEATRRGRQLTEFGKSIIEKENILSTIVT